MFTTLLLCRIVVCDAGEGMSTRLSLVPLLIAGWGYATSLSALIEGAIGLELQGSVKP